MNWIKNTFGFMRVLKTRKAIAVYLIVLLVATNIAVFTFTQSTTGKALIFFAQNQSEVITQIDEMRLTKEANSPKE